MFITLKIKKQSLNSIFDVSLSWKNFLFFILILTSYTASAGWYECYNFKGKIGDYPITLSFQYRPGHFGEQEKQNLNIIGCYKYDRVNTPIRLEGIFVKESGKIILNEVGEEGRYTAYFELEETAPNVWRGGWESLESNKILDIELHLTTQLNDTEQKFAFSNIELLQSASLPDYYFVGVYKKTKDAARTFMSALKIISKKDNTVFQILNFDEYFYDVGNVKTIIYDNVEFVDPQKNSFSLWCDAGRMGDFMRLF